MTDIVDRLMREAHLVHRSHLDAEFGPAGGNPNAKLEQSLEYQAAQEIRRLRQQVLDMCAHGIDCLNDCAVRDMCFTRGKEDA